MAQELLRIAPTHEREYIMNRRLLLPLLLAPLGLLALPEAARAQCPPDAEFCGEVQLGPARAQAVVRRPAVVAQAAPVVVRHPAPRRVVVEHPPTQVVVQQPPARIVVRHPPPRVVVVHTPAPPPPQPVVVHHPAPVYQPAPAYQPPPPPQPAAPPRERFRRVGLFATGGGILADQVSMGGLSGGLVIRPARHFGIRLGIGGYGGEDYNGATRTEVPFTNDFLVYFNPRSVFQVYFLAGFHVSAAVAETTIRTTGPLGGVRYDTIEQRYNHIGGQTGLGAELRLGRAFALTFDARVFLREQVRDDVVEFREVLADGTVRETNTSAGALLQGGAVIYF